MRTIERAGHTTWRSLAASAINHFDPVQSRGAISRLALVLSTVFLGWKARRVTPQLAPNISQLCPKRFDVVASPAITQAQHLEVWLR
jgi:hypothetical protein